MQGFLDDLFLQLETIDDDEGSPKFVESVIGTYFTDATSKIEALGQELFGARRVRREVDKMRLRFNANDIEGLKDAYQLMRNEHLELRSRMLPYAELLHILNSQAPPPAVGPPADAVSVNNEDAESVDSNEPIAEDQ
ncbi:hypothetical protein Nepgr_015540 [Nepenthes gracilis]|uniref:Histidine-containing phosphotransfer protein n=1 Tax=Nepenthes gracilis TaxID=150966 RepID=A0AAD3SMZ4_NEPGR|nr:hypothetical protein Nepgr_015540 [Nepenthes gracilis]